MLVVLATGDMPSAALPSELLELSATSKQRLVVPLQARFGITRCSYSGYPSGYQGGFNPTRFLAEHFGLVWNDSRPRHLMESRVMLSTLQVALALEMAGGDLAKADILLSTRDTKNIREAEIAVSKRFGAARCLTTTLWKIGGNADRIWFALRDEMERVKHDLAEVAL